MKVKAKPVARKLRKITDWLSGPHAQRLTACRHSPDDGLSNAEPQFVAADWEVLRKETLRCRIRAGPWRVRTVQLLLNRSTNATSIVCFEGTTSTVTQCGQPHFMASIAPECCTISRMIAEDHAQLVSATHSTPSLRIKLGVLSRNKVGIAASAQALHTGTASETGDECETILRFDYSAVDKLVGRQRIVSYEEAERIGSCLKSFNTLKVSAALPIRSFTALTNNFSSGYIFDVAFDNAKQCSDWFDACDEALERGMKHIRNPSFNPSNADDECLSMATEESGEESVEDSLDALDMAGDTSNIISATTIHDIRHMFARPLLALKSMPELCQVGARQTVCVVDGCMEINMHEGAVALVEQSPLIHRRPSKRASVASLHKLERRLSPKELFMDRRAFFESIVKSGDVNVVQSSMPRPTRRVVTTCCVPSTEVAASPVPVESADTENIHSTSVVARLAHFEKLTTPPLSHRVAATPSVPVVTSTIQQRLAALQKAGDTRRGSDGSASSEPGATSPRRNMTVPVISVAAKREQLLQRGFEPISALTGVELKSTAFDKEEHDDAYYSNDTLAEDMFSSPKNPTLPALKYARPVKARMMKS